MNRRAFLAIAAFAVLPTLAGCMKNEPLPQPFADIRFANDAKIVMLVDQIDVVHQFEPTLKPPQVEHQFPVTPERALENFVRDRFVAAGQQTGYRLRYTIVDAGVRQTDLPRKEGVAAAFTVQVAERYDGHAAIKLELINPRGFPEGSIVAEASSSRSVVENASLNDRERVWYEIARELAGQIGTTVESGARQVFAKVIRS